MARKKDTSSGNIIIKAGKMKVGNMINVTEGIRINVNKTSVPEMLQHLQDIKHQAALLAATQKDVAKTQRNVAKLQKLVEQLLTAEQNIKNTVSNKNDIDKSALEQFLITYGSIADDIVEVIGSALSGPERAIATIARLISTKAKEERARLSRPASPG